MNTCCISFNDFLHLLKAVNNFSVQVIRSAEPLPPSTSSNGPSNAAYLGMQSVSCLYEPIQLLACFTVCGGSALIKGDTTCDVGVQPFPTFFHPKMTVSWGAMITLEGLKVNPQSSALARTSTKLSSVPPRYQQGHTDHPPFL